MILLLFLVPALLLSILVISFLVARTPPLDKQRKRLAEGIMMFEDKRFEEAFVFFDKRIRNGEKCCMTYLYRGLCHAKKDNLNSALYDLTTVLSYDNSVVEVYLERGKIYFSLGETDKAVREFERAVFYSQGKKPDILRYRGLTLMEKGQYFQAARYLRKAMELGDEEANHLLMAPPFHNSLGFSKDPYNNF